MPAIAVAGAAAASTILASISVARATHETNCFTTQEGITYCKEESISNHEGGQFLLSIAFLILYIGLIVWLSMKFEEYFGYIIIGMTSLPFLIFGLIFLMK